MTRPPLATTLLSTAELHPELTRLVVDVSAWSVEPTVWSGGRAGWVVVPDELANDRLRGLKFKGLGSWEADDRRASPPSTQPYDRWPGQAPDPHFGIDDECEFILLDGDAAPVGGLAIPGVLREQRCAAELSAARVPCVRPVAAVRYDDRSFRDGGQLVPLGVSVTGSPLSDDHRLSSVAFAPPECDVAELGRLERALGIPASSSRDETAERRMRVLGCAYAAFASSLRGFAAAGWYRYSGHPGNISVDADGTALLVDLDSCRPMADRPAAVAGLEEVRDGMSALYNLACTFFQPGPMESFADDLLLAREPFSQFIASWDPDGPLDAAREDGARIARYVVESRTRLRFFESFLSSPTAPGSHLYRYVRHDRDLTFSWLFRLLYRRRLDRPSRHELPLSLAELDARLRRFAGLERFRALRRLDPT